MTAGRLHGYLALLAAAACAVSLVFGGYQVHYPINQNHQIPLLLALWDPVPFADDAFVQSLFEAPHLFWSMLAAVLTPATLDTGLFVFFVAFKWLFLGAVGSLAAAMARRHALLAGAAAMLVFISGRPPQLGGEITHWNYLTHTQAAQALTIAALAALAWRRPWAASVGLAGAALFHPLYSVFGWAYFLVWLLMTDAARGRPREERPDGTLSPRRLASALVLPALAMIPFAIAAARRLALPDVPGWGDWIYEHYPMHHEPERFSPVASHAYAALLSLALLAWAGSLRRGVRTAVVASVTIWWATYAASYGLMRWTRSPLLLQLQPFRITGVAIPVVVAAIAAAAASRGLAARRWWLPSPALGWGVLVVANYFVESWSTAWTSMAGAVAVAVAAALVRRRLRAPGDDARAALRRASGAVLIVATLLPVGFVVHAYVTLVVDTWSANPLIAGRLSLPSVVLVGSIAAAWLGALGCRAIGLRRTAAAMTLLVAAATLAWVGNFVADAVRRDRHLVARNANPAMMDVGRWLRDHTPPTARLATPIDAGLRGIRCASWRTCILAEMDESAVYYDPTLLPQMERREEELGKEASRRFLRGDQGAYLAAIARLGATHLVAPVSVPLRGAEGWRQVYTNGMFRVWERR